MRVIVTGGAGFVGSNLCHRLAPDHDLMVIDNFSTGSRASLPPGTEVVELDLGTVDGGELAGVVGEFGPDAAVHLAAIHFIPHCMEHPDDTFAVNVRGTDVVCRALDASSCRKLVLTSTADVYEVIDRVHREDHRPAPRNIYGLSKLLAEEIVEYTAATSDHLSAVTVRLANVYGPGETNPHVVPDVLDRLASRQDDEIRMGWLGSERDFVHVSDVVDAITTCLLSDGTAYATYNLGSGVTTPVRELVDILRRLAGDGRPVIEDAANLRRFDRRTLSVDISKVTRETAWRPTVSLRDGLDALVQERFSGNGAPTP